VDPDRRIADGRHRLHRRPGQRTSLDDGARGVGAHHARPDRGGSRFREVQSAGGRRIETICEIIEFDPERRYAWRSVGEGPASYGGGFTATAVDGQTELRYEGWATATGRLAAREAAWARQAQREAEAELEAIKDAVEERVRQRS
jgi:hypothetical protein